jgi:hypothetical protein
VRITRKIEARISTIQQETTMTTEIKVRVTEDAFEKNDLIRVDRSAYGDAIALSAADWIACRTPQDEALSDILRSIYNAVCERMSGYSVWLLLGDSRWQNDTRIVRYRKKFNSLKAQGIDFETIQDRQEFMVERDDKLKFFGVVRLNQHALSLVPATMLPGSCTYILALPDGIPALPYASGWSGKFCEDSDLVKMNVERGGIIFQRVGYFDDLEVGFVALGKLHAIETLTRQ